MKKLKIVKKMSFHAGHQLPSHDGKCQNIHGHEYNIEVGVTGPLTISGSSAGMIIDFYEFDEILQEQIHEPMDHAFLISGDEEILPWLEENNKKIYKIGAPTTVENIANHLYMKLASYFDVKYGNLVELCEIRVFETPDTYAEITKDAGSGGGCGGSCGC